MRKQYKTVLVGFGSVAVGIAADQKMARYIKYQTHAQVLVDHPDFDWIAVVDPDPDARRRATDDWGISCVVPSAFELPTDLDLDVAVLATRPGVRTEAIEQIQGLKAIIVEKPLGYEFPEAWNFSELCASHDLLAQVNLFRRADQTNRELAGGRFSELVGEVQSANIIYGNGLRNNGIHMIDLVRMLLGEVISVQAIGPSRPIDQPIVRGDSNIAASLTLESGAIVTMQVLDFDFYRDVMIDIWGQKGRLEIYQEGLFLRHSPLNAHRALEGVMETTIDEPASLTSHSGTAYYALYDNLADALDGKAELCSPIQNAIRDEMIVDAVFRSAATGGSLISI